MDGEGLLWKFSVIPLYNTLKPHLETQELLIF